MSSTSGEKLYRKRQGRVQRIQDGPGSPADNRVVWGPQAARLDVNAQEPRVGGPEDYFDYELQESKAVEAARSTRRASVSHTFS